MKNEKNMKNKIVPALMGSVAMISGSYGATSSIIYASSTLEDSSLSLSQKSELIGDYVPMTSLDETLNTLKSSKVEKTNNSDISKILDKAVDEFIDVPLDEVEDISPVKVEEKVQKTVEIELPKVVENTVGGFSIDQVIELGELASLAYADVGAPGSDEIKQIEILKSKGWKTHFIGTNVENSGIIFEAPDGRVIVSYHGSSSRYNWGTNGWANSAIDEVTGSRLHNGFLKGFRRTEDQVMAILERIGKGKQIIVTGHSMGAALATVLMDRLSSMKNPFFSSVKAALFACPRVLSSKSAEAFNARNIGNVINISQGYFDPVSGIATSGLLSGRKQVGEKLRVGLPTGMVPHVMTGILKSLREIRDGTSSYKFVSAINDGICDNVPGLKQLLQVRRAYSDHIADPIHRAWKSIKDKVVNAFTKKKEDTSSTVVEKKISVLPVETVKPEAPKSLWGKFKGFFGR